MKFLRLTVIFLLAIFACSCSNHDVSQYVDPLIGTDGHGHVYPGAALPFGMVQLSPDTRKDSWDGCSGYHYSDTTIMGFSHTHLSGTGVGDYGDIRFMPTVGELRLNPGAADDPSSGYRSTFSHANEVATPGYYSVILEDYDVDVELTVTKRAGFHKYTYPEGDKSNIIIDLTEGVTSDRIIDLRIEFVNDTEVQGLRRTDGWSNDQYVFFNAKFSKPFKEFGILSDGVKQDGLKKAQGKDIKAWLTFDTEKREEILVKVGISAVDVNGAKNNRENEIPGWDFSKVQKQAGKVWNDELSKIGIEDGNSDKMTVFYTAMYHALLNPNLYSDYDGKYRGHDMNIHQADDFEMFTVFSLWDTYRAEHPLLTIIDQERTVDFILTMLKQYEQGGLLPVWELAANETNCMIGYHAVPVIVDAYMKGIRDYNVEEALDACIKSAMQDQFGLKSYKARGYIPSDKESESVSKTLEYAYDDWCIAQMAKELNRPEDYELFMKRAQNYKNIFDPETGFMRAKSNETWFSPFDPREVNFNYTEANSWQYSLYVPQDVTGLMKIMGGPDKLSQHLDHLFTADSKTSGRHQSDITGLIGQYAHGNEPSHHMAYLYNYTGEPWKTQEVVRRILDELYSSKPDGLCGNEDCGQMSAWYVLSAMGFYPVTPGSNMYAIGSPVFEKTTIHLGNGKEFIIEAKNVSDENKYIQTATLNGKVYPNSFLTHQQIMNGGFLSFEMGSRPSKNWGMQDGEIPVSEITEYLITPVPFVKNGNKVFHDDQDVEFGCADPDAKIFFTVSKGNSVGKEVEYVKPIKINKTTTFKVKARSENRAESYEVEPAFLKIPDGRSIRITNAYANQYSAGGDIALIDFQHGGTNFRTGLWQGYEGVDLDVVIDLGKSEVIQRLSTGFLEDINAWIFMPEYVDYFYSADGRKYIQLGRVENTVEPDEWNAQIRDFTLYFDVISARYIKVIGKNRGVCPSWHKGAGNQSWIFADEVAID